MGGGFALGRRAHGDGQGATRQYVGIRWGHGESDGLPEGVLLIAQALKPLQQG